MISAPITLDGRDYLLMRAVCEWAIETMGPREATSETAADITRIARSIRQKLEFVRSVATAGGTTPGTTPVAMMAAATGEELVLLIEACIILLLEIKSGSMEIKSDVTQLGANDLMALVIKLHGILAGAREITS